MTAQVVEPGIVNMAKTQAINFEHAYIKPAAAERTTQPGVNHSLELRASRIPNALVFLYGEGAPSTDVIPLDCSHTLESILMWGERPRVHPALS